MPTIHLVPLALYLYVVWRFVFPLPLATEWKWLVALALLAIAQQHLVIRKFFGGLASPEMPSAVLAGLGWLFGAFVLLAAFLLLKDVVAVLLWLLGKSGLFSGISVSGIRWGLGACVAALMISGFGVWQAMRVPAVRTVEIRLAKLPAELDGLKLVQISDLHASSLFQAPWVRAVVDKANALDPDLIMMTGDLVDGKLAQRTADVAPLRDLKARHGVFAVTGNHEYYADHAEWMDAFDKLGLRMLLNEHTVIGKNGTAVVLAGITDSAASRFAKPVPDVQNALAGAPENTVTILMAHRPGHAGAAAEAGADLQLSGHTHGGQMPGIRFLARRFNSGFVSGVYRIDDMKLYVSNGTGLWGGFPIRIGTPSEITQIVLRTDSNGEPAQFAARAASSTDRIQEPVNPPLAPY